MIPPMPEGFTDQTAWDIIHWEFSKNGTSTLDQIVIYWQQNNQERVRAALIAKGSYPPQRSLNVD